GVLGGNGKPEGVGTNLDPAKNNAFADISLVTPPWRTVTTPSSSVKDFFASSNLTENFSEILSYELLVASEKGAAPNRAVLDSAMEKIQSKALELNPILASEIKINAEAKLEDKLAYVKKIHDIMKAAAENSITKELNGSKSNLEKLTTIKNRLRSQRKEISSLSVPAVLVPLHKTLLSFLDSHEKFFESLGEYQTDPVKTILTIQNKEKILAGYMSALNAELSKVGPLMKLGYESKPSWWVTDSMAALFVPQVAHAQQSTIDLAAIGTAIAEGVKDAARWAKDNYHDIKTEIDAALKWVQTQLEWANKLATEQLKNVLVQLFVQQSIAWVNGGGNPQFVTNWRLYADTATRVGMSKGFSLINDDACGTFGPLMIDNLNTSFNSYYAPSNCQPSALGQALNRFRTGSFADGGWSSYGMAISPQGNYFQSYTNYATRIEESSEKEREAQVNKIVDGFKPTETCPESEPFVGPPEQNETPAEEQNQSQAPVDPLPDGSCEDGSEPSATTPGIAFKAALENAITIPGHRINNGTDLLGLGLTLASGALTKTMAAKSKGITSLGDGASFQVTANQTSNLQDVCGGYKAGTPGYTACMQSVGSAGTVQADLEENVGTNQALDNLRAEAQSIGQNRSTLVTSVTESLAILKEFLVEYFSSNGGRNPLTERIKNVCSQLGTSNPDRARIEEIRATKPDLETLRDLIEGMNTTNQDLLSTDLLILSRVNDPAEFRTRFDQFTTTYGTLASTTQLLILSQNRKSELQATKLQAERNIENPCNTAIQRITPALLVNP
ncbi:MAG: hypothetical protein AAB903_02180, partial [Patescibacteria group bacterium]